LKPRKIHKNSKVTLWTHNFDELRDEGLYLNSPGDGFCGYSSVAILCILGLKADRTFLDKATPFFKKKLLKSFNRFHGRQLSSFNEVVECCVALDNNLNSFCDLLSVPLRAANHYVVKNAITSATHDACGEENTPLSREYKDTLKKQYSNIVNKENRYELPSGFSSEYQPAVEIELLCKELGLYPDVTTAQNFHLDPDKILLVNIFSIGAATFFSPKAQMYSNNLRNSSFFRLNLEENHWTLNILPQESESRYYNSAAQIIGHHFLYHDTTDLNDLWHKLINFITYCFKNIYTFFCSLLSKKQNFSQESVQEPLLPTNQTQSVQPAQINIDRQKYVNSEQNHSVNKKKKP
jgi:hypothetical protein